MGSPRLKLAAKLVFAHEVLGHLVVLLDEQLSSYPADGAGAAEARAAFWHIEGARAALSDAAELLLRTGEIDDGERAIASARALAASDMLALAEASLTRAGLAALLPFLPSPASLQ